jgi:prepilin-type N-terminal cleavage/methylation domain-containing protein
MREIHKYHGFTLIELLIVIFIISVLVSLSIVSFKNHKERAYLTQDGMVLAKNCIGDLISYCITHPEQTVDPSQDPNCQNTSSVFGSITFTVEAPTAVCSSDGQLPDQYTIIVRSSVTNNYHIECTYYQSRNTYRCMVKENH